MPVQPAETFYELIVIPRARKTEFQMENNIIRIKINTAPEKGKANKKILDLLAKELKIPRNNITMVKGEFSRHKVVRIISGPG